MVDDPYRMLPMQIPTLRNTVRPVQLGAGLRPTVGGTLMQQPPTSTAQMMGARNMYAPQSLQAGVMRQAQQPKSQAELLAAYGLGRKPVQTVGSERRGAGAPAARTGLSGMLPAAGTPEMAGLGAAGRTLMQLGGWQDKPMTLGQILGAGAEKGIEAMQARRDAIAAAEEKKAAAEAAAEKEAFDRRMKEREVSVKEAAEKRQSATGPSLKPTSGTRIVEKDGAFYEEQYAQLPIGTPGTDSLGRIGSGIFKPVDKAEAKAKAKDEGYIIRDGKFIGKAVRDDEGVVKLQTIKGELLDISPADGDILMSEQEYKAQQLSPEKMQELSKELNDQIVTRQKLNKFMEGAETASEGVALLADQFSAATKTFLKPFLGKYGKLDKSEIAARIQEGELNALVGGLRLETVGGGVMTEQDALRVISRLGGNINAWRSKQAVREAVGAVLAEKNARIEQMGKSYNREVDFSYFKKGYKRFDPLSDELKDLFKKGQKQDVNGQVDLTVAPQGFPAEDWAVLSDKDKRDYLAAEQ